MQTLVDRLRADTPSFWRKMQWLAMFVAVVVAKLQASPALVPPPYQHLLDQVFQAAGVVLAMAQFARQDDPPAPAPGQSAAAANLA